MSFSKDVLEVYANPSIIHIDRGRKAGGKMPPKKPIEEWVRAKNLHNKRRGKGQKKISFDSLVYLIRRKIGREGIKPTPILQPFSMFLLGKTTRKLQEAYGKDLHTQFVNGVKPFVSNAAMLSVK